MNPFSTRNRDAAGSTLKVAVLSRNPEMLKNLSDFLATDDSSIQLQFWPAGATHLAAMVEQEQPGVLLLETAGGREDELNGVERVMIRHPDMAVILICAQNQPEFLLSAMRMGVREVIPMPVSGPALQQAIGRIRERISWRSAPQLPGQVLAFLPCKGGSGSTFLAANLAYAIAAEKKRVCLIDLNLHFGDAALHVSEQAPSATVADLVAQIQRLDGALLESSMLRITPYFGLLAAPDSPENAVDVRPESIERLITVARGCYDYVLLDLSRTLDANSIKALDCADAIYLVLQLTLPFIRDGGRLLQIFASLGYPKEKVRVLVNRFEKDGEIGLRDVEQTLGLKVARTIPNSFGAVAESINHGRPIIDLAPRDPVARALRELAGELVQIKPRSGGWWQRLRGNAA
ncbi:MAG: AAA family ATPase [Candidatus Accumulibacter sp.]|nr:AAA family ATPase [Accumulibacter sp.]